MKRLSVLIAVVVLVARAAAADVLLQTADNIDLGLSWLVNNNQYLAARLHVDRLTSLSQVGGHIYGTGTLFFAIVKVAGPNALPVGHPFNDDEVVWWQTFTAGDAAEVLLPADVTLTPGDYLVLSGSGRFGATGSGGMNLGTPLGAPTYLFTFLDNWHPYALDVRFVVHGQTDTAHVAVLDAVSTRASQASVTQLAADVSTKATQASVDGVLQQLMARATQASVDGVSQTLATKASQSSVDALSSTVATQESIATLDGSIDGVASSVGALATQQQLADASGALSSAVGTRASQASVDALNTKIDAQDSGATRLEIERTIADGARVLSLMLPQSAGGRLETVRQIVDEAIAAAQAAGLATAKAAGDVVKGDAALAGGDFRAAYLWYVNAYQQLIK